MLHLQPLPSKVRRQNPLISGSNLSPLINRHIAFSQIPIRLIPPTRISIFPHIYGRWQRCRPCQHMLRVPPRRWHPTRRQTRRFQMAGSPKCCSLLQVRLRKNSKTAPISNFPPFVDAKCIGVWKHLIPIARKNQSKGRRHRPRLHMRHRLQRQR